MKMKFVVLFLLLVFATTVQAYTFGTDADTYIRDATNRGNFTYMDIRGSYNFDGYMRFDLSSLSGKTVADATLTLTVSGTGSRNDTVVTGRVGLWGLNDVVGNTPQNWGEMDLNSVNVGAEYPDMNYSGGYVTNLDMEAGASITETIDPNGDAWLAGTTITITGSDLVAFLQGRIDAGSVATLILNQPDGDRGYGICSKEWAGVHSDWKPKLEIIPEPATIALLGLGGLGLIRRRKR